jgi:hypothetical protein
LLAKQFLSLREAVERRGSAFLLLLPFIDLLLLLPPQIGLVLLLPLLLEEEKKNLVPLLPPPLPLRD